MVLCVSCCFALKNKNFQKWPQLVGFGVLGLTVYTLLLFMAFQRYGSASPELVRHRNNMNQLDLQGYNQSLLALENYTQQIEALQAQQEAQQEQIQQQQDQIHAYEIQAQQVDTEAEQPIRETARSRRRGRRQSTARARPSYSQFRRSSSVELEYIPGEAWRRRKSSVCATPPGMEQTDYTGRRSSNGLRSHAQALEAIRRARERFLYEDQDDQSAHLNGDRSEENESPLAKAARRLWQIND